MVRINYYPPRGDNKEGWDNIDLVGWLGYPMQLKINFLCRDSILAAPIVLDLVLLLDLAGRAGWSGIQEWLSFYFKSPMHERPLPEHDLHPVDEAENTQVPDGRGSDHPSRRRILLVMMSNAMLMPSSVLFGVLGPPVCASATCCCLWVIPRRRGGLRAASNTRAHHPWRRRIGGTALRHLRRGQYAIVGLPTACCLGRCSNAWCNNCSSRARRCPTTCARCSRYSGLTLSSAC